MTLKFKCFSVTSHELLDIVALLTQTMIVCAACQAGFFLCGVFEELGVGDHNQKQYYSLHRRNHNPVTLVAHRR